MNVKTKSISYDLSEKSSHEFESFHNHTKYSISVKEDDPIDEFCSVMVRFLDYSDVLGKVIQIMSNIEFR